MFEVDFGDASKMLSEVGIRASGAVVDFVIERDSGQVVGLKEVYVGNGCLNSLVNGALLKRSRIVLHVSSTKVAIYPKLCELVLASACKNGR